MFERFTDRARRIVVLAQEEARALNHQTIDASHFLLGMLYEEEGFAAHALTRCGLTLQAVQVQVVGVIPRGDTRREGHLPFTREAKKALELSLRESLGLDHNYIGTEHLLLVLIALVQKYPRDSLAIRAVFNGLNVDLKVLRETVLGMVSGDHPVPSITCPNCGAKIELQVVSKTD